MLLQNVESFSFSSCSRPSFIWGLLVCLCVQDLAEAIPIQEVVMCRVNSTGEDICKLSTPDDASRLQTQLKFLNTHWAKVCQQLIEQKRRCVSMIAGQGKAMRFFFNVFSFFCCCSCFLFCLFRATRCLKIPITVIDFINRQQWRVVLKNVVHWLMVKIRCYYLASWTNRLKLIVCLLY